MTVVQWCNENSGFVSAVLALITVFISTLAIFVSIKMAHLPFKKKMKLGGTLGYVYVEGISSPAISGFYVNACNTGNRAVNIKFLGFAVSKHPQKDKNDYDLLYNPSGNNASKGPVKSTDIFEVLYPVDGFVKTLQGLDRRRVLYYYLRDTEGDMFKKKYKTVGEVLELFEL